MRLVLGWFSVVVAVSVLSVYVLSEEQVIVIRPGEVIESFEKCNADCDPLKHWWVVFESFGSPPTKYALSIVENSRKQGYTGVESLLVDVSLGKGVHPWGTFLTLLHIPGHPFGDPLKLNNDPLRDFLSNGVEGIRFWVRVHKPDKVLLRCSFYDVDGSGRWERWATPDEMSNLPENRWWKHCRILQSANVEWQEVKVPFKSLQIPWWAPEPGNDGKLNLRAIKRWEVSIVSTTEEARSVKVEFGAFEAYKEKR
jgi:hypothetical protein